MIFPVRVLAAPLVARCRSERNIARLACACLLLLPFPTVVLCQPCSLDLNFNPDLNPGAAVYAVLLQPDGHILIGGSFSSIDEVPRANVARLNKNGTLDESFDPGTVADIGYVSALALQPDGKIVIGGSFSSSLGVVSGNLTRLNTNGTQDATFKRTLGVDGPVNAIIVQPDGKILFGGGFGVVDTVLRRSIARVDATGNLDAHFDACVASSAGSGATGLALLSDGKMLASGLFTFSTGLYRYGIARLGECGDLDPGYAFAQPGLNSGSTAYTFALRGDGSVLLGGNFNVYRTTPRSGIVQLNDKGSVDLKFDPGAGIESGATVYTIALQSDGKALLGGDFSSYDGHTRQGVARVDTAGRLDMVCDAGEGPNNSVSSFAIQPDGKILVAGKFTYFDGQPRNGLARLNADPRLEPPTRLPNGQVQLIFHGTADTHYTLQASSNLTDWASVLIDFIATDAPMPLLDPSLNAFSSRFYRTVSLPPD